MAPAVVIVAIGSAFSVKSSSGCIRIWCQILTKTRMTLVVVLALIDDS